VTTQNICQPPTSNESRFVTIRMAAETLSVSGQTIRRLIYGGELPAVRLGSLLRIPRVALEEYIEENFVKTAAR
jgi:excisionase family DNA binding protein